MRTLTTETVKSSTTGAGKQTPSALKTPTSGRTKATRHTSQSKSSPAQSNVAKVNHYCVTCTSLVGEKAKAIPCDLCNLYTHLTCDCKISNDLYNAISNCEGNSLIYLCINCRPILPKSLDQLMSGLLSKVEAILDQKWSMRVYQSDYEIHYQ